MSDPYGDAEAARYDNPVASRRWILELLEETGRPLDYEELVALTKTEEINRRDWSRGYQRCVVMVR